MTHEEALMRGVHELEALAMRGEQKDGVDALELLILHGRCYGSWAEGMWMMKLGSFELVGDRWKFTGDQIQKVFAWLDEQEHMHRRVSAAYRAARTRVEAARLAHGEQ